MREGATRGAGVSLQVLEIYKEDRMRQTNDLLPYLPEFRKFFAPLPKHKPEIRFRVSAISLNDLQCITQASVKVCACQSILRRLEH